MNRLIPSKVVRKVISDILIERSNKEDEACRKMQEEELRDLGLVLEYSSSIGWEAAGTRVLADEILSGQISIEMAIRDFLDLDEIKEAKKRCEDWIKEKELSKNEAER